MKQIIVSLAALLFAVGLHAQNTDEVKGFQWGLSARYDWYMMSSSQVTANLSAGYRFNRQNYLGLQGGYGPFVDSRGFRRFAIPILLDYMHYYPMGNSDRHSVYVGVEAGALIHHNIYTDGRTYTYASFFPSGKVGLDLDLKKGLPHLTVGAQVNIWGLGATLGVVF